MRDVPKRFGTDATTVDEDRVLEHLGTHTTEVESGEEIARWHDDLVRHGIDQLTDESSDPSAVHTSAYFLQLGTGGLADRIGRRPPVIGGLFLAGALGMVLVEGYLAWVAVAGVSGSGWHCCTPI